MGFLRTSLIVLITAVLVSILPSLLTPSLDVNIKGNVAPGWEKVEQIFRQQVENGEQQGGSFSVYHQGELVVNLVGGYADIEAVIPWEMDTLCQFFSTTKGISAVIMALLVDRGFLDYEKPVVHYWPEFGANGKDEITIKQLFSHQAGLCTVEGEFTTEDIKQNSARYVEALSKQKPLWTPGKHAGYHALTIGMYQDQVVRRTDPKGRSLQQFFREELAEPLGLDFYIGLPLEENWRTARNYQSSFGTFIKEMYHHPEMIPFLFKVLGDASSLFWTTVVPKDIAISNNMPKIRETPISSSNGFGTAESVAKLYGMISGGGVYKGKRYFSEDIIQKMGNVLFSGDDYVLADLHVDYGYGFLVKPNPVDQAPTFGTPGAGGQMGFGDRKHELGWAYVSNFHMSTIETDVYAALRDAMWECATRSKKI